MPGRATIPASNVRNERAEEVIPDDVPGSTPGRAREDAVSGATSVSFDEMRVEDSVDETHTLVYRWDADDLQDHEVESLVDLVERTHHGYDEMCNVVTGGELVVRLDYHES